MHNARATSSRIPLFAVAGVLSLFVVGWFGCSAAGTSQTGTGKGSGTGMTTAGTGGAGGHGGAGDHDGGDTDGGDHDGGDHDGGTGGGQGGGGTGCTAGQKMCGMTCVATDDPMYGCGPATCTPCDVANATPVCMGGACVVGTCDTGFTDCNGNPADGCETATGTDPANCGGCGVACELPNATATCSTGMCSIGACAPGFTDCDNNPINGCETNTQGDPGNCDGCDMACATNESCVMGACGLVCAKGTANCDGNPADGCNVTLGTLQNCAFCGDSCMVQNATTECDTTQMPAVCVIKECDQGFADCDGLESNGCETNTGTDSDNCGTCNNLCASGPHSTPVCSQGVCGLVCAGGWGDCDHNPVDGCETPVEGDPNNCGACQNVCTAANGTAGCSAGSCTVASCNPGYADCDGLVPNGCETNTSTSVGNCGTCGNLCSTPNGTPQCTGGACGIASCNPGFGNCNGQNGDGCETNTGTSLGNCGGCGIACTTPNGTPACNGGTCAIAACNNGYADCNGLPVDGCETNLGTSTGNCGACGKACSVPNATPTCTGGACAVQTCNQGFADCDGNPVNGCEVSTTNDPGNCGACGKACSVANGTPACSGSSCVVSACNPGFADCNNNPADGCETNTTNNPSDCGGCGKACSLPNATAACSSSSCVVQACNTGFGDCDGNPVNGCETNLGNSTGNCGTCNNACAVANGAPACVNGGCAIAGCNPGFADCDNNPADGCETNLGNSSSNCGSCGNVCNLANATAACTNGGCVIATCNAGFADCDGSPANGCEVNILTNVNDCGTCGNVCAIANGTPACTNGACAVGSCAAGFADCDNNPADGCEINTGSNVNDCGSCGHVCNLPNATATCTNGACAIGSCNAGFGDCDGNPANGCETNIKTTTADCGSCGNACNLANATPTCTNGGCTVLSCNSGFADCDGLPADGCEVNVTTSVNNCGSCGHACAEANASATCVGGACAVGTCSTGFADCNGNPADGCEVNVTTSPTNCGSCGNVCVTPNATPGCASGSCTIAGCNSGFADCNGNPADGCETVTSTNVNDCGSCGHVCTTANGTPGCAGGSCTTASCNAGYSDCNGNPADGCEINTQTNPNDCGSCGHVCALPNATAACTSGGCVIQSCNAGWADCDGNPANGCETNILTTVGSCGSCGHACSVANGSATCVGGACAIGSCNSGFADCDGQYSDGCEINTQTNPNDCGTCGHVCSVANGTAGCAAGSCDVAGCNTGFADCDGQYGDGCEVNIETNVNDCGACGHVCSVANGTASCSTGSCHVAACNTGFADCNGVESDGCEVNLESDTNNCGTCNNKCSNDCVGNVATLACNVGTCAISTCNAGYYNVDGTCADGCECKSNGGGVNCGSPTGMGSVPIGGGPLTATGNLVPLGTVSWYTVTFTNPTPNTALYHPKVTISGGANGEFKFNVYSNCTPTALACGVEGGLSNGVTTWEVESTTTGTTAPEPNPSDSTFTAPPVVGNGGTILIEVFRAAGALTCDNYTLTVTG